MERQLSDQDMRNESCILRTYTTLTLHTVQNTLHTAHCIQYIKYIGVVSIYKCCAEIGDMPAENETTNLVLDNILK